MLSYQTTLGQRLYKVLSVIAPILIDCRLGFSVEHGLISEGLTPSTYVKLSIPRSGADHIKSWEPDSKTLKIGMDLKTLASWLKDVQKGDVVNFELKKERLDRITVRFWNDNQTNTRVFPVLDLQEPDIGSADALPKAAMSITVNSKQLEEFLKRHALGRADRVQFKISNTEGSSMRLCVKSRFEDKEGGGLQSAESSMSGTASSPLPITEGEWGGYFSISDLRAISKASCVSNHVKVVVVDSSISFLYDLGSGGKSTLLFKVAAEPHEDTHKKMPQKEVEEEDKFKTPTKKIKVEESKPPVRPRKRQKKRIDTGKKTSEGSMPSIPIRLSQKCGICNKYVLAGEPVYETDRLPGLMVHEKCRTLE